MDVNFMLGSQDIQNNSDYAIQGANIEYFSEEKGERAVFNPQEKSFHYSTRLADSWQAQLVYGSLLLTFITITAYISLFNIDSVFMNVALAFTSIMAIICYPTFFLETTFHINEQRLHIKWRLFPFSKSTSVELSQYDAIHIVKQRYRGNTMLILYYESKLNKRYISMYKANIKGKFVTQLGKVSEILEYITPAKTDQTLEKNRIFLYTFEKWLFMICFLLSVGFFLLQNTMR